MVVHNVTSLTRLLDVASLLDGDLRLQVVFTWTRSSPFTHDVERFLADMGAIVVPWDQARALDADLAVAASYGGELEELSIPLMVVSHGMGYNKHLIENRKSKIEGGERGRGVRALRRLAAPSGAAVRGARRAVPRRAAGMVTVPGRCVPG